MSVYPGRFVPQGRAWYEASPPPRSGTAEVTIDAPAEDLSLCWLTLPGSRPGRELYWLSQMPRSDVHAVGEVSTGDPVRWHYRPYRRASRRFVEAGALAWFRGLDSLRIDLDWVASLELCALVSAQGGPFARRLGARQAVITWGNDPRNPLYRVPIYRQATDRSKQADLIICTVEAALDHCVSLGVPQNRCRVVLPPVDTELFHPPPTHQEAPIAIFSSPLAPNKGIDHVLDAFDLVRATLPDARLRVIGRGPLEGLVRERARATDGAVELLGLMDRHGVADQLRDAAVLVTAPRPTRVWNEQFGLAYVEAMACGLPIVTTICGSNHEAVGDANLRVADEVPLLAEALRTFLVDPALRREVGARNRADAVERFEFHQQVGRLRRAFAEA